MNAIILNAGMSSAKMKTYEPRAILKINGTTLIENQYLVLKKAGFNEIRTVVGYKSDKLIKKINHLPIEVINNPKYEETNNAYSLKLAYKNSDRQMLLVHGDILFDLNAVSFDKTKSCLVVDRNKRMKAKEVGVVCSDIATNLSYGISTKWCQIAFFTGQEFEILYDVLMSVNVDKKLTFELINSVIQAGGVFDCYEHPDMKILEIDSIGDFRNEKNKNTNC